MGQEQLALTVWKRYCYNVRIASACYVQKEDCNVYLNETLILSNWQLRKAEIYDSISKTFDKNREDPPTQNNKPKYRAPLTLTYNRTLPNVKEAVRKHWNILQINNEFKNVFPEPAIMCFLRNKNLKYFLWTKTVVNNKAQKVILSNRKGYSIPCHSKPGNLWCKQVEHTNTFSSTVTKMTCNIYNKLNCKSSYLIYLMECTLWQHTGKSETAFNFRLNNHRKDVTPKISAWRGCYNNTTS